MKIEKLKINGFRKLHDCTIDFADATFVIGENNVGKSSLFGAIKLILTNNVPTADDFTMKYDEATNANIVVAQTIEISATFTDVPDEADEWIGFRGRIFVENDKRKIKYKKTFGLDNTKKIEIYEKERTIDDRFKNGAKITTASIIAGGIDPTRVNEHFVGIAETQNLNTNANRPKIEGFPEIWLYGDDFQWIENPGGIPQNVISRLPRYIIFAAEDRASEIDSKRTSALGEIMTTIFNDVIDTSENFEKVKEYYEELAREVDTENAETEFGKIMSEVNETIKSIFPDSAIYAKVNLSDPSNFLRPEYDIKLGSNIMTPVRYQGTGMIRSTAFSLLKFREEWRKKRDKDVRNLIICFEEPELFLHPSAASQMRDSIYNLAGSRNQIICTSHSPYMIDLSREKERQIVNNMSIGEDGFVDSIPFSVTEKFQDLHANDKSYVKMLLRIDDVIARSFFARRVVIIEGDTEDVVLNKTISLLEETVRTRIRSEVAIVKARGKSTIPPLINYLSALGIENIFVIHDRDQGKPRAEEVNPRILNALGSEDSRSVLEECVEDVLGYPEPSNEKPFKAFKQSDAWARYEDVPEAWRAVVERALAPYLE